MDYRRFLAVTCLAALHISMAGCGDESTEGRVETVPVTGTFTVDGKSYGPALLSLIPEDSKAKDWHVEAQIKDDGTFALRTYSKVDEDPDGAPVGKYTVDVQPDAMSGKMLNVLNPLSVEIKKPAEGGTFKLEIKMTSKKGGGRHAGPGTSGDNLPKGKGAAKGPGGI